MTTSYKTAADLINRYNVRLADNGRLAVTTDADDRRRGALEALKEAKPAMMRILEAEKLAAAMDKELRKDLEAGAAKVYAAHEEVNDAADEDARAIESGKSVFTPGAYGRASAKLTDALADLRVALYIHLQSEERSTVFGVPDAARLAIRDLVCGGDVAQISARFARARYAALLRA